MQLVQLLTTTEANACPKSATRAALAEEQHNGINLFIALLLWHRIHLTAKHFVLMFVARFSFCRQPSGLGEHTSTFLYGRGIILAALMATAGLAPSCCPVSHRILRTCSEDPAVPRPVIVCPRLGINERDARMSDSNYSSVRLCQ